MSLYITNVNVAQQAPLATVQSKTTSGTASAIPSVAQRDVIISRRQYSGYGGSYLPQIDEQLAMQLDPLVGVWRWSSANVPQGWYRMLVTVQGVLEASSSSSFVQNGTNVGCVLQFYPPSSTPTSVVATAKATTTGTSSSKVITHTGAVAGGIPKSAQCCALRLFMPHASLTKWEFQDIGEWDHTAGCAADANARADGLKSLALGGSPRL
jgi:hypothetical protein